MAVWPEVDSFRALVRFRTWFGGHNVWVTEERDEVRDLVLRAYARARESGKSDWRTMSIAVLKNRINQVLGASFDQRLYGYRRVLDMVLDLPDLLAVDQSTNPPSVTLVDRAESGTATTGPAEAHIDDNVRVRPDLWRAVVDYRSGEPYVLVDGFALPASDAPEGGTVSATLPTVDETEVGSWRHDFAFRAADIVSDRPDDAARLEQWARSGGPTKTLPGILHREWNRYQTAAVLSRLQAWFESEGVPLPPDLTVAASRPRRPDVAKRANDENDLRMALISCIRAMPYEELRQVLLPAASLLRPTS